MMDHADLIVVGGGIIGLATGYEAARSGAQVTVIEKDLVGQEQSSRNWGFTRQQNRHVAELALAKRSIEKWGTLSDDLGYPIDWRQGGNLILAGGDRDIAGLEAWSKLGKANGIDTRVLDGSEVGDVAPFLAGVWPGGMYTASDGHVNPREAVAAYRYATISAGCTLMEQTAVTSIITAGGAAVGVRTSTGQRLYGSCIVVAAGCWSRRLLKTASVSIPVQWVRASVAATNPVTPFTSLGVWGPGCAFRQASGGEIVVAPAGATDVDAMVSSLHDLRSFLPLWAKNYSMGFRPHIGSPLLEDLRRGRARTGRYGRSEPAANEKNLRRAIAKLHKIVPVAQNTSVARRWAGYIDGTPDGIAIIGRLSRLRNIVLATGFSGHGFGVAPAVGEAVAELALNGNPRIDLSPFSLERFAGRDPFGARPL